MGKISIKFKILKIKIKKSIKNIIKISYKYLLNKPLIINTNDNLHKNPFLRYPKFQKDSNINLNIYTKFLSKNVFNFNVD